MLGDGLKGMFYLLGALGCLAIMAIAIAYFGFAAFEVINGTRTINMPPDWVITSYILGICVFFALKEQEAKIKRLEEKLEQLSRAALDQQGRTHDSG